MDDGDERLTMDRHREAQAATMVATTSPAPSPRSSARTPALVADSVRLRSIERFARRKATEDRTNSPRRRAQVSDLRKHSVCGTGVAEKRRLGDASKAKIETLVAIGAQHPDAFGLPGASPGVRECADSVQGALYHSGSFENRGARMDYAANDRSSIARLGVGAEGVPDSHPAKPALAHLAPAARPLPLEPGWTLAGKEREAMQGAGSPSAIREEAAFAAAALPSGARRRLEPAASASAIAAPKRESLPRWDTDAFGDSAFDAAALEAARGGDAGFAKAAAGREGTVPAGPSGRPGGGGDGEKGGGGGDGDGDGSVLATLRAAGDAVRTLSLAERKALFEVAVQEHVAALTRQLFPQEDGAKPRVNIDIAV